jgi:hypothetical protein
LLVPPLPIPDWSPSPLLLTPDWLLFPSQSLLPEHKQNI